MLGEGFAMADPQDKGQQQTGQQKPYTKEELFQATKKMFEELARLRGGTLLRGCCTQGCCQ
jgi:hypothetical protein